MKFRVSDTWIGFPTSRLNWRRFGAVEWSRGGRRTDGTCPGSCPAVRPAPGSEASTKSTRCTACRSGQGGSNNRPGLSLI